MNRGALAGVFGSWFVLGASSCSADSVSFEPLGEAGEDSGGSAAQGGASNSGGASGKGGSKASGGASGKGGASSNGGASGKGGASSNGGASGKGGASSNGGKGGASGGGTGSQQVCGDKACAADQYCSQLAGGVPGSVPSYQCMPLNGCQDCECLKLMACQCSGSGSAIKVVCAAP